MKKYNYIAWSVLFAALIAFWPSEAFSRGGWGGSFYFTSPGVTVVIGAPPVPYYDSYYSHFGHRGDRGFYGAWPYGRHRRHGSPYFAINFGDFRGDSGFYGGYGAPYRPYRPYWYRGAGDSYGGVYSPGNLPMTRVWKAGRYTPQGWVGGHWEMRSIEPPAQKKAR